MDICVIYIYTYSFVRRVALLSCNECNSSWDCALELSVYIYIYMYKLLSVFASGSRDLCLHAVMCMFAVVKMEWPKIQGCLHASQDQSVLYIYIYKFLSVFASGFLCLYAVMCQQCRRNQRMTVHLPRCIYIYIYQFLSVFASGLIAIACIKCGYLHVCMSLFLSCMLLVQKLAWADLESSNLQCPLATWPSCHPAGEQS